MAEKRADAAPLCCSRNVRGRLSPGTQRRRWSDMLPDILENISDCLPLSDLHTFREVCLSWRAAPSGRAHITQFNQCNPWLLVYGRDDDDEDDDDTKEARNSRNLCYLYDIQHPRCCTVPLPDLRGATCLYSKAGWLLAHRERDGSMFFYNPFTFERIDLPKYPNTETISSRMCVFVSLPTSPSCVTFLLRCAAGSTTIEVDSYRVGDENWKSKLLETGQVWLDDAKLLCDCFLRFPYRCDVPKEGFIMITDSTKTARYNHVCNTVRADRRMRCHRSHLSEVDELINLHRDDLLLRCGVAAEEDEVDISICRMSYGPYEIFDDKNYKLSFGDQRRRKKKKIMKLKAVWINCSKSVWRLI